MKKIITTFILALFAFGSASAHYLWLETNASGQKGSAHEIKVHFGEYTYGLVEKVNGEAFPSVSRFQLWVIQPNGERLALTTTAKEDHYLASFVLSQDGIYTVVLNNNDIDVIDYTQYDFGIFKTHYHSTAKIQVGSGQGDTQVQNGDGLAIKQLPQTDGTIALQVFYKDQPMAQQEVKIYVADLWSKTLETDAEGKISFALPWNTKYLVETTTKEEVPGTFKGDDYEFIWHCATYCIK